MRHNNNQQSTTPHLCPVWAAEFHALQSEHNSLMVEAQTIVREILASPLKTREKFESLKSIAKKLESLAEKLESTYQIIYPHRIPPEVLALKEALEKDYQAEIAKWQWYPKTRKEADGTITNLGPILQQNPETGTYFYTGNYDGRAERGGKGENFTDQKFVMPTLAEAMKMMTVEQSKLYLEMKEAGEEPKLQLVPIALTIRTLGRAIDSRSEEIKINEYATDVVGDIQDAELIYEPESLRANNRNLHELYLLITRGGISKSEYIRKYNGWAVEIIATKPELTATKPGTNAQKTEAFMAEAIPAGYRGGTFESYLSAQKAALQKTPPEKLDASYFTIIPDSGLGDEISIADAHWYENQVCLGGNLADEDSVNLRFRRLIRLKKS